MIEEVSSTVFKAVATSSRRRLLDFFDLGSSKDYVFKPLVNVRG
ncbi:MAG: hypothetical protein N3E36_06760 [Sulfolobales archaeon]|nr:hypothetical protein [Sulfolobales archaeon]